MTWTYDLAHLATSEKDQVRLEIGDVVQATVTLADEEIVQAIATERNMWGAAARCAEMLARRFMTKADVRLGRAMTLSYTKTADQYFEMARVLRKKAIGANVPWVGGMSVSDKGLYEQTTDLVQPAFTRTMQENPLVGGYTSDSGADVGGENDIR